jgi:hypothetical protein
VVFLCTNAFKWWRTGRNLYSFLYILLESKSFAGASEMDGWMDGFIYLMDGWMDGLLKLGI